jgi:hypothetical protein
MRRHTIHKIKMKNYNFYIVGSVFLLMILTGVFLLNSTEYEYNIEIPCSDINAEYNLIKDDDTYDFMIEVFGSDLTISDSTEFFKIHYLTTMPSDELIEFLSNLPDTIANNYEKKFLLDQLTDECFAWDKTRLKNFWVLTPEEHARIPDTKDHYDEFKRIFGANGSNYFSKPIFNKEKTLLIFERSQFINWEAAYGDIFV